MGFQTASAYSSRGQKRLAFAAVPRVGGGVGRMIDAQGLVAGEEGDAPVVGGGEAVAEGYEGEDVDGDPHRPGENAVAAAPAGEVGDGGEAADDGHVALVFVCKSFAAAANQGAGEVQPLRFGDLAELGVAVRVGGVAFDEGAVAEGVHVVQPDDAQLAVGAQAVAARVAFVGDALGAPGGYAGCPNQTFGGDAAAAFEADGVAVVAGYAVVADDVRA